MTDQQQRATGRDGCCQLGVEGDSIGRRQLHEVGRDEVEAGRIRRGLDQVEVRPLDLEPLRPGVLRGAGDGGDVGTRHGPASGALLVGGGTVALLLAVRLARKGIKTLVLECGGPGFESAAQELNEATQSGRIHDGITNARARVLGGTSNLWGGQLAKFVPNDFKEREGIADAPWPVSYDDLVPYYESVARELGLGEELHSHSTAIDSLFPSGYPQFPEVELFFTRWLSEPNFASYFRQELTSAENLTIWLHSYVK